MQSLYRAVLDKANERFWALTDAYPDESADNQTVMLRLITRYEKVVEWLNKRLGVIDETA